MVQYIEKKERGAVMNISDKTLRYTMRLVGSVVLVAAVALIVYLTWITGNVGLDMFLIMALGIGMITMAGGIIMIYLSHRIIFGKIEEAEPEYIYLRESYMLARRCS